MRFFNNVLLFVFLIGLQSCAPSKPRLFEANGTGMEARDIDSNVYLKNYDEGFKNHKTSGWDPNLQFVWSRLGAAKELGIKYNEDVVIKQLVRKFGQDPMVHKMVGIGFHQAQVRKAKAQFSTRERVNEIRSLLPAYEKGEFSRGF